jgi:hypothetical protein
MTIELGLLLLESLLLVATIVLLIYNIHEGKQRENLLKEVGRATRVLTRHEYFFTLMDSMLEAKDEIIGCVTGRPPSGDDIKMTTNIIDAIRKISAKGVRIKYLLPKFPDRLRVGIEYAKAGAEVLFSSCLMVHNLRYSVIDDKMVVLGIPEHLGEKEATKKGYKIPSEGLALVLKDHFATCERQTNLKEYLREVIEQTGATTAHLAHEFHLDERDLESLLAPSV